MASFPGLCPSPALLVAQLFVLWLGKKTPKLGQQINHRQGQRPLRDNCIQKPRSLSGLSLLWLCFQEPLLSNRTSPNNASSETKTPFLFVISLPSALWPHQTPKRDLFEFLGSKWLGWLSFSRVQSSLKSTWTLVGLFIHWWDLFSFSLGIHPCVISHNELGV